MSFTLHFQGTGLVPANAQPAKLIGKSLTLGRGEENDVLLPDPDKVISKRHCVIEDHSGNFVVMDISTNGTFLNYSKTPLGKTPTPLSNGDILVMGPFELLVEIIDTPKELIPGPVDLDPVSVGDAGNAPDIDVLLSEPSAGGSGGDFLDDLLGGEGGPAGPSSVAREELGDDGLLAPIGSDSGGLLDPLPEETPIPQGASQSAHSAAISDPIMTPRPANQLIPDDWGDDDFLAQDAGPEETPPVQPDPTPQPPLTALEQTPEPIPDETLLPIVAAPEPESEPQPAPPSAPVAPAHAQPQTPAAQPAPSAQSGNAARAFLAEAGASDLNIPDEELESTLARMGKVFRTLVTGMREVLMTRSSIKSEFRIEQTMITAGGNNPLKFSISPEQAIEAMIKPTTKGYLDAPTAADQALNDIKAHEIAMMTGMEAALKGVLAKLDPKELEGMIQVSGGLGSMLKGKKARYWEVYEKMYAQISDQAENDFQNLFRKEFARAYQEQLERLK